MPTWEELTPYTDHAVRPRWSATLALLIAHVVAFVVSGILVGPATLGDGFWNLFGLTRDALDRAWLWQFLTYPFVFDVRGLGILILILMLYMLWIFGRDIEAEFGPRRLLIVFLGSALYGAAAHLLYVTASGTAARALGNLYAPTLGVVAYAAVAWPRRKVLFFWLIPMPRIVMLFIVLGIAVFLSIVGFAPGQAPVAIVGSILFALAMYRVSPAVDRLVEAWRRRAASRHAHREYELRRRVDGILDKIRLEGMDSLTREERGLLDRASRTLAEQKARHD